MPDIPFPSASGKLVELQQAWSWVCPQCNQLNYTRGNVCKDPEILAEAREELGPGDLVLQPEKVFCCKCEHRFDTKNPMTEDDHG